MYRGAMNAHVLFMVVVEKKDELTVLLFSCMRMKHLLQNLHAFLYKWFPIYRNNHVPLQYLSPTLLC